MIDVMIDVYGVIGGMIDMMTDVYVIMCMALCVNDMKIGRKFLGIFGGKQKRKRRVRALDSLAGYGLYGT